MGEVTNFPPPHPAAVILIPDERGFCVIIRGRPDLAVYEAVFDRISLAQSHAFAVAKECDLDLIITAAALGKVTGR